jgi:hypothetical protein
MTKKFTQQTIKMLPIKDFIIGGYQLPINMGRVKSIVAEFDEARLGIPIVSLRGGKYHLVDGDHRITALRMIGVTHTLCLVLEGLNYEQEAEYFRTQNENSRPLTKYNLFKAGIEAGVELYVKIDEITHANGFAVSMGAKNFNSIGAIYALTTICSVYGYETLDKTLKLLRDTWNGISNVTRREFLVGTAAFINRYGTAQFAERLRFKSITEIWQDYLTEIGRANPTSADPLMREAFCRTLVRHYNKGLSNKSSKRLVMEGKYDD